MIVMQCREGGKFKGKYKKRKDPANYNGRWYADYLEFIQQHPDVHTVEMDTVYNQQSGPYFLIKYYFPNALHCFPQ